jgi:hypothetical protein
MVSVLFPAWIVPMPQPVIAATMAVEASTALPLERRERKEFRFIESHHLRRISTGVLSMPVSVNG